MVFSIFEKNTTITNIYKSPFFWHGVVLSTLFNIAVVYSAIVVPDWMWMYYVSGTQNSVLEIVYILLFLYYAPYFFGFMLGLSLKNTTKFCLVFTIIFLLITEAWLIWHLFPRYSVVGTTHEFLNQTAPSLFGKNNPIATVMNVSVVSMVVYFIFTFYLFLKKSRMKISSK